MRRIISISVVMQLLLLGMKVYGQTKINDRTPIVRKLDADGRIRNFYDTAVLNRFEKQVNDHRLARPVEFLRLSDLIGTVSTEPLGQFPKYLSDVAVEVRENDSIYIEQTITDSNGYFFLKKIQYDRYYKVYFSKSGYYSRYIWLYTYNVPDSLRELKFDIEAMRINLKKIVNKETKNPFIQGLGLYKYEPVHSFPLIEGVSTSGNMEEEMKSFRVLFQGGIVEDKSYKKGIEKNELAIETDLIAEADKKNTERLEISEFRSRMLQLEREKITREKQFLSQSNKMREAEIIKEKAVSAAKQRELEISEQEKKIQELSVKSTQQALKQNEFETRKQRQQKRYFIIGLLIALLIAGFIFRSLRLSDKQNRIIGEQKEIADKQRQRSEELLLNILPSEVAEELKVKGKANAKLFEDVTVLYTDFKDFTIFTEKVAPQALVTELDNCFNAFDEITSKYNIEKIKTVGDAYLAVCGLPVPNVKHAENVVNAAIDIREFMLRRRSELNDKTLEIRIGIHSGSVVAGIVGVKKFAYDIWGDAVNTAARLEQNSEAGKINISQTTYDLVKDKFDCQYRGEIEAKNKGKLRMYFVR